MVKIEPLEDNSNWLQSSNLYFKDDGLIKPGAKTKQFSVYSRPKRELLGYIKWWANWRQYCFFPLNALFNKECLLQIAQFCEDITFTHKSKLPNIQRQKEMTLARRQRRIEKLTKAKKYTIIETKLEKDLDSYFSGGA